jgi:hypothetical protein
LATIATLAAPVFASTASTKAVSSFSSSSVEERSACSTVLSERACGLVKLIANSLSRG